MPGGVMFWSVPNGLHVSNVAPQTDVFALFLWHIACCSCWLVLRGLCQMCVHLSWHDCRHVHDMYVLARVHLFTWRGCLRDISTTTQHTMLTSHWFGKFGDFDTSWRTGQNGRRSPHLWLLTFRCGLSALKSHCHVRDLWWKTNPFFTHVGMLVVLLLYHDTTRSSYVFIRFSILSFSLYFRLHVSNFALRESDKIKQV